MQQVTSFLFVCVSQTKSNNSSSSSRLPWPHVLTSMCTKLLPMVYVRIVRGGALTHRTYTTLVRLLLLLSHSMLCAENAVCEKDLYSHTHTHWHKHTSAAIRIYIFYFLYWEKINIFGFFGKNFLKLVLWVRA